MYIKANSNYLAHHGIKGQKWGVRRYQNPDGTYTEQGKKRRQAVDRYNKSAAHYMKSFNTTKNYNGKVTFYDKKMKNGINLHFDDYNNTGRNLDLTKKATTAQILEENFDLYKDDFDRIYDSYTGKKWNNKKQIDDIVCTCKKDKYGIPVDVVEVYYNNGERGSDSTIVVEYDAESKCAWKKPHVYDDFDD